MKNFNFSIIEGTVKDDVCLVANRTNSYAEFKIVTKQQFTDLDGTRAERENDLSVIVHGKLAEVCSNYLKAGSRVLLSGAMDIFSTTLEAREVNFLKPA